MEDKKKLGIIGIIAVLLGSLGTTLVYQDNTYVCPLTQQVGVFDHLSHSGKTGYWYINGTLERASCRSGHIYEAWIPIKQYVEDNNLFTFATINKTIGTQWTCNQTECVVNDRGR